MTVRQWFRAMRGREAAELLHIQAVDGPERRPFLPADLVRTRTLFDTMAVVDRATAPHYRTVEDWLETFPSWDLTRNEQLYRDRIRAEDGSRFRSMILGEWKVCRECAEKDAEIARLRERLADREPARFRQYPRF